MMRKKFPKSYEIFFLVTDVRSRYRFWYRARSFSELETLAVSQVSGL
jgi:hypothetical protein